MTTSKAPEKTEAVSAPDTTEMVKCDNHPQRNAVNYTQGGAVDINLCAECTPSWFTEDDQAR